VARKTTSRRIEVPEVAIKGDDFPLHLSIGEWVQLGYLEEYRSREGVILFRRNRSPGGTSCVVYGFKVSEPYWKGKIQCLRFMPFSPEAQKKYRKGLRRRARVPIYFWKPPRI
jgi:hypothetical protein